MFGFGPEHTRTDPVSSSLNTSNVASLTLKGTAVTGAAVESTPAVANGVVYVGSNDSKLYAFPSSLNGTCSGSPTICPPVWTAATGGPVGSSPAVVGGVVYVGSNDGKLYAFDAAGGATTCTGTPTTCTPLWTATTGGPVGSSPAVVGGVVYVGSNDGKLYAFDAAGGATTCTGTPKVCTPLWTAATADAVFSSPAVVGGVVYVGSNDGKLYAFDAAGGATTCTGTPKVCTPLWTATTAGVVASSPAVAGGVVYVGSNDGKLYAFDAAGGAATCTGTPGVCVPLWVGATGGAVFSSPAVSNDVVYVGSADKKLYAFDATPERSACSSATPKVCSALWTAATGSVVFSSPSIENGVVFVGSSDKKVYAFDGVGGPGNCSGTPKTCTPLWSYLTGYAVFSSPTPAAGGVYVGSGDGNVYGFGL
jgi:outer membrane protein assembly factor BamB